MNRFSSLPVVVSCALAALSHVASAQPAQPPGPDLAAVLTAPDATPAPYTLGAFIEGYYQWNVARPSNGITNFRGFDNRHNAFTLANAGLDLGWEREGTTGRLVLQVGHTGATYYAAEPSQVASSGANATGAELWRYIQQANVGHRFDVGRGLTVAGGLFLSPIGPEGMVIRDNWNWSRSNLFFGLPFYHTGARVSYPLSATLTATVAAYNGWNSVVDNNPGKSVSAQLAYSGTAVTGSLLYFGGSERAAGAPEGQAWRHLIDAHAAFAVSPKLSVLAHGNVGTERNVLGRAWWLAGALYGRYAWTPCVTTAVRADWFREQVPVGAGAIFWPAAWVSSGTATLDYKASSYLLLRLEYRYDRAASPMFFSGGVDDATANGVSQQTLTLGFNAWI